MIPNEQIFLSRYNNLNREQKEAVDVIYGPVMVIAGPGTGKTEILAMRIANLLLSDAQVKAHEILCLTYTDEGSVAMRKRLLEIIGRDAHRVHIYTFHAFCNNVIQSNPQYFGMRDLKPLDELERTEILHELLEDLPQDHLLRRLKGDIYYDAKNLFGLFDIMKSENWSPDSINNAIDDYINDLPNREFYQYKKSNAKKGIRPGDPKQKEIDQQRQRMERTRSAVLLYDEYQMKVDRIGRYDFSDMILWVIKAFKENDALLQSYQERFQFVLVDEFQDTSLSQSELLHLLMGYDDRPNLFVVGDDDQSIFAFQGARVKNVEDFYETYRNTIKVIVLKENYRSSQTILDASLSLIDNNQLRLIKSAKLSHLDLDKSIISAASRFKIASENIRPVVKAYYNKLNEEADIVRQIAELKSEGVALNTVAVLYSQHKQAESMLDLMERKGLPYWVKRSYDVLQMPVVIQILHVLRYINAEQIKSLSGEDLLFELMHAPFLNIAPIDIARISLYMQNKECKYRHWRFLLLDNLLLETMELSNARALYGLGILLEKWIGEAGELTMPMLIEKILYEGGVVNRVLKSNTLIWDMQVLYTFFDFVKEESARQKRMNIPGFLHTIDKMQTAGIAVPIQKVIRQEDGVRFYTAYGAKGHEFEYIFLVGCNKDFWEKKPGNRNGFMLPDTLTKTNTDEESGEAAEVMRRVFFVALTRAKKHLQISYSLKDNSGKKDLEASVFIDEATGEKDATATPGKVSFLPADELVSDIESFLLPPHAPEIQLAKKELLDKRLENFSLSVSSLNKYLKCPIAFYYENMLQVPLAKNDSFAFGVSIHYALEQFFRKMQNDPDKNFPVKAEALQWFKNKMKQNEDAFTKLQYERRIEFGEQTLSEYLNHYTPSFNRIVVIERMISNTEIKGVPIKGKLDKIEFDGNTCTVVDYKTGNPVYSKRGQLKPPSNENENGGDYWRQMIFYKILLDNFPEAKQKGWQMKAGVFDYIEKDEKGDFVRHHILVTPEDTATVTHQIIDTWQKIHNHDFYTGCGKADCHWCRFVRTNRLDMGATAEEEQEHSSL